MTEQPNRSRTSSSSTPRARTRKGASTDPAPATPPAASPSGEPEAAPAAQAKITIPAAHPMVAVLGTGDSILRVIEQQLPGLDLHARGNEITATGPRDDVELAEQLFAE